MTKQPKSVVYDHATHTIFEAVVRTDSAGYHMIRRKGQTETVRWDNTNQRYETC